MPDVKLFAATQVGLVVAVGSDELLYLVEVDQATEHWTITWTVVPPMLELFPLARCIWPRPDQVSWAPKDAPDPDVQSPAAT